MNLESAHRTAILTIALALVSGPAIAQYKWQTPDGRTVYGDVPPPTGAQRLNERPVSVPTPSPTAATTERPVALPYALQQVASRQPVVLYTAVSCDPCEAARKHLNVRGIPFAEKTVSSNADLDAMKGLGFTDNSFPALSIGRDRTVGFEPGSWDRLLTAAGYPRESRLPAGYRQAPAEALTGPPAQKIVVTASPETPSASAEQAEQETQPRQRSIDAYRAQLLERARERVPETPTTRF